MGRFIFLSIHVEVPPDGPGMFNLEAIWKRADWGTEYAELNKIFLESYI